MVVERQLHHDEITESPSSTIEVRPTMKSTTGTRSSFPSTTTRIGGGYPRNYMVDDHHLSFSLIDRVVQVPSTPQLHPPVKHLVEHKIRNNNYYQPPVATAPTPTSRSTSALAIDNEKDGGEEDNEYGLLITLEDGICSLSFCRDANYSNIHPNVYAPADLAENSVHKVAGGGSGVAVFSGQHPELGNVVMKHGDSKDLKELFALATISEQLKKRGEGQGDVQGDCCHKNESCENNNNNNNNNNDKDPVALAAAAAAQDIQRRIPEFRFIYISPHHLGQKRKDEVWKRIHSLCRQDSSDSENYVEVADPPRGWENHRDEYFTVINKFKNLNNSSSHNSNSNSHNDDDAKKVNNEDNSSSSGKHHHDQEHDHNHDHGYDSDCESSDDTNDESEDDVDDDYWMNTLNCNNAGISTLPLHSSMVSPPPPIPIGKPNNRRSRSCSFSTVANNTTATSTMMPLPQRRNSRSYSFDQHHLMFDQDTNNNNDYHNNNNYCSIHYDSDDEHSLSFDFSTDLCSLQRARSVPYYQQQQQQQCLSPPSTTIQQKSLLSSSSLPLFSPSSTRVSFQLIGHNNGHGHDDHSHSHSYNLSSHHQHHDHTTSSRSIDFGTPTTIIDDNKEEEEEESDDESSSSSVGNGYMVLKGIVDELIPLMEQKHWKCTLGQSSLTDSINNFNDNNNNNNNNDDDNKNNKNNANGTTTTTRIVPTKTETGNSILYNESLQGPVLRNLVSQFVLVTKNLNLLTTLEEKKSCHDVLTKVRAEVLRYEWQQKLNFFSAGVVGGNNNSINNINVDGAANQSLSVDADSFVGNALRKNVHPTTGRFHILNRLGKKLRDAVTDDDDEIENENENNKNKNNDNTIQKSKERLHLTKEEFVPAKHLGNILKPGALMGETFEDIPFESTVIENIQSQWTNILKYAVMSKKRRQQLCFGCNNSSSGGTAAGAVCPPRRRRSRSSSQGQLKQEQCIISDRSFLSRSSSVGGNCYNGIHHNDLYLTDKKSISSNSININNEQEEDCFALTRIWTCGLTDAGLHNLFLSSSSSCFDNDDNDDDEISSCSSFLSLFDLGEPQLFSPPGFLTKFLFSFFHTLGMQEITSGNNNKNKNLSLSSSSSWVRRFQPCRGHQRLALTKETKQLLEHSKSAFEYTLDRIIKELFNNDQSLRWLLIQYITLQLLSDASFCVQKWRIQGGGAPLQDRQTNHHYHYNDSSNNNIANNSEAKNNNHNNNNNDCTGSGSGGCGIEKWLWRALWDIYISFEINTKESYCRFQVVEPKLD